MIKSPAIVQRKAVEVMLYGNKFIRPVCGHLSITVN